MNCLSISIIYLSATKLSVTVMEDTVIYCGKGSNPTERHSLVPVRIPGMRSYYLYLTPSEICVSCIQPFSQINDFE